MAGTIVDFFGYLSTDKTDAAKLASARRQCPFLGKQCTKPVAEDDAGGISGACAVAQIKDATPTICCPIRLYADDYKMLKIIAYKSFGVDLNLYSGKNKLALYKAKEEGGAVAVYGHDWGGELKLPKRDGVGNYFVDWPVSTEKAIWWSSLLLRCRLSIPRGIIVCLVLRYLSQNVESLNPQWA